MVKICFFFIYREFVRRFGYLGNGVKVCKFSLEEVLLFMIERFLALGECIKGD